ncbi:MAG: hypothetical protein AABZ44_09045, partial [Elusimicrobiota bacterium]
MLSLSRHYKINTLLIISWLIAIGAHAQDASDAQPSALPQALQAPAIFPRSAGQPIMPSLRGESMVDDSAAITWERFIEGYRPMRVTGIRYNDVRRSIEYERRLINDFEAEELEIEKRLAIPPDAAGLDLLTPKPKEPELEIPEWQGKVNIAGRKLIGLSVLSKKFINPAHPLRPRSTPKNTFELKQELQLRVQGNVSDRVVVNVDYDDTKENKRDISIVYRGAPGEAVKEISFGDITLNLPQTQFTSYSKQLFGIKAEFDFKRARLMAVGSQSKGTFAIRKFSGQYQFESKDILDTAYIRRTYYNAALEASHLPLQSGSVIVYRDDRIATNDANAQQQNVGDYAVISSSTSGKFDILVAGIDYIVDYQRGIIRFTSEQALNSVIAIDYTSSAGTRLSSLGNGLPKIIKTDGDGALGGGDCASSGQTGCAREMKTFYSINRNKIARDDGTGNFLLKVLEKGSRKDATDTLNVRYPNQIFVNFEAGTFELTTALPDPEIYQNAPISKYIFFAEYKFVLKTYMLQPNIVLQSEKVYQNGRLLQRDLDYYIDYDSGFISFTRPDTITPATEIEVTFEVAPFGNRLTETLIGARGEADLIKDFDFLGVKFSKLSFGSSVLLQQAAKPASIPDARSLPSSYSIIELDAHLLDLKIPGPIPLTSNLHAEIARSVRNPNTFKKALIESMEGIKIEDAAALSSSLWLRGANPDGERSFYNAITLRDESFKIKDINPNFTENDSQQVLAIDYDLTASSQASIVYVFSQIGLDFSNKESLLVSLVGDTTTQAPDISFQLGRVNEDSDSDGALDSEDINSDGGLNFGEDIGWSYNDPNAAVNAIGPANGRLDSEDLDRNGRLDTDDPFIGGKFGLLPGSSATAAAFTSWYTTSVPLGITPTNQTKWSGIKEIRITLTRRPETKLTGTIRIARLSVTGSRWERAIITPASSSDTFRVTPINNVDDPQYTPLFIAGGEAQAIYDDLYTGSDQSNIAKVTQSRREQALRLSMINFESPAGQTAQGSTRLAMNRTLDMQTHKVLAFFAHGPVAPLPAGATFFFRVGSSADYYEYRLPLADTDFNNAWHLIRLGLDDLNKDGLVDQVSVANHPEFGAEIVRVGNPNLASVSEIVTGVRLSSGIGPISQEIWIDDIILLEPRDKKGTARYVAADFDLPRWIKFGGAFKTYGQEFEGLGQGVLNQAFKSMSGFANINRLQFLPINLTAAKTETVTPSVIRTGPGNLVSSLSEGRVESLNVTANGSLDVPRIPGFRYLPVIKSLPALSWNGGLSRTDNTDAGRKDETQNYGASTSWPQPFGLKLINGMNAGYSRKNYILEFSKPLRLSGSDNLREFTDNYDAGLNLNLLKSRLSIAPTYRLSKIRE